MLVLVLVLVLVLLVVLAGGREKRAAMCPIEDRDPLFYFVEQHCTPSETETTLMSACRIRPGDNRCRRHCIPELASPRRPTGR